MVQLVRRQQAETDENVVQRWRIVTLRRKKQVTRRRTLVEITQLVEKQPAHDLERAEAGADVAGPRTRNHVERVDPRQRGECPGALHGVDVRAAQSLEFRDGDVMQL